MWRLLAVVLVVCATIVDGQRACGTMQSFFSTESRIVGGVAASDYAWPWQVYILLRGHFICGGTLIDSQYVLTAAHCVYGESDNPKDFVVQVGVHNMARSGSYTGTPYQVTQLFVHELYTDAEKGYDLAILRLIHPVGISDMVNVICLPTTKNSILPYNTPVVITGFGVTEEGGSLPYTLQQAIIQLLPSCGDVYPSFNNNVQICAGLRAGGRDTCQGDSGGPLVYQPRRSSHWIILGITSYGSGCARDGYPGVYTRVSNYLDWILQKIQQSK